MSKIKEMANDYIVVHRDKDYACCEGAYKAGWKSCLRHDEAVLALVKALKTLKEINIIAGFPHLYDETQHSDYCAKNGCYGHWKQVDMQEIATKALENYWLTVGPEKEEGEKNV